MRHAVPYTRNECDNQTQSKAHEITNLFEDRRSSVAGASNLQPCACMANDITIFTTFTDLLDAPGPDWAWVDEKSPWPDRIHWQITSSGISPPFAIGGGKGGFGAFLKNREKIGLLCWSPSASDSNAPGPLNAPTRPPGEQTPFVWNLRNMKMLTPQKSICYGCPHRSVR